MTVGLAARSAVSDEVKPRSAGSVLSVVAGAFGSARRLMPTLQPPASAPSCPPFQSLSVATWSLSKSGQLERLAVKLLQFRQREAEMKLAGRDPVRLAVDHDEMGVAAARRFRPPHFQAPLRVFAVKHARPSLCRGTGVDLREGDVLTGKPRRVWRGSSSREHAAASDDVRLAGARRVSDRAGFRHRLRGSARGRVRARPATPPLGIATASGTVAESAKAQLILRVEARDRAPNAGAGSSATRPRRFRRRRRWRSRRRVRPRS